MCEYSKLSLVLESSKMSGIEISTLDSVLVLMFLLYERLDIVLLLCGVLMKDVSNKLLNVSINDSSTFAPLSMLLLMMSKSFIAAMLSALVGVRFIVSILMSSKTVENDSLNKFVAVALFRDVFLGVKSSGTVFETAESIST